MRFSATLAAVAAAGFLAAGCAANGTSPMWSNTEPLAPLADATSVQVENHNWSDIVVYAVQNGTRVRLGMVTSMNTETFELPTAVLYSVSALRLLAAPIGSPEEFVTYPVQVAPGQRVELRLENVLAISNVSVW